MTRLVLFGLMAFVACSSTPTDTPPASTPTTATLAAFATPTGHAVPPDSRLDLAVRVLDPDGQPMPGALVDFIGAGELATAGGAFEGGGGAGQHLRVETDEDGVARAGWAGDARSGAYILSAALVGAPHRVHFAVRQVEDAALPPTSAEAATDAARALTPAGAELLGPILLQPGDAIEPFGGTPDVQAVARDITAPAWLLWIDDAPGRKLAHPTRIVYVTDGDPEVIETTTYPVLKTATGRAPLRAAADLVGPERSEAPVEGRLQTLRAPLEDPTDACAIVIAGPWDDFLLTDAARARSFFLDELGIPSGQVFSKRTFTGAQRPSSLKDIEGFLDLAAATGCSKLFLFISAHGSSGGSGTSSDFLTLVAQSDPTQTAGVTYTEIGEAVGKRFANKALCVIIDACQSAGAIDGLQGYGFSGEVFTATDQGSQSIAWVLWPVEGSFFTDGLFDEWEDLLDDDPQAPLGDAFDNAKADGDSNLTSPNPQRGIIHAAITEYSGPDFRVEVGEVENDTTLELPDAVKQPPATCAGGGCGPAPTGNQSPDSFVTPEGIADVRGQLFRAPEPIPVRVEGLSPGTAEYRIELRTGGRAYRWTGTVEVVPGTRGAGCTEDASESGAVESVGEAIGVSPGDLLDQAVCGNPAPTRHSTGTHAKPGAGDHTQTVARAALTVQRGAALDELLPCGPGPLGTTLCAPTTPAIPPGDVHVVVHVLSGAVPLFDTTHHYQYGFVFDADGDPSNNYEADASYPDDFFAGTDRWYEAAYTPSAGWSLKATDATTFAPVQTSARIALVNDTVTLLVPASEMTAESPRYRVTAFEHKGDYGIAEPHDWKGDVEPPVAEGLSSF